VTRPDLPIFNNDDEDFDPGIVREDDTNVTTPHEDEDE
jgi:hypothetical protein